MATLYLSLGEIPIYEVASRKVVYSTVLVLGRECLSEITLSFSFGKEVAADISKRLNKETSDLVAQNLEESNIEAEELLEETLSNELLQHFQEVQDPTILAPLLEKKWK